MSGARKKRQDKKIKLDLTTNEAILMLVGAQLISELIESIQIRDQAACEELIDNLIGRLENAVGEENTILSDEILEEMINSFLPEIHISDIGNTNYDYPMYSIEEKLPIIERAIEKKRVLEIEYYSMSREDVNARHIKPFHLQERPDFFVLLAYCKWREDIRLFRVDRIKSLHLLDDKFKMPKGFDLEEYVDEEYI